MALKITIRPAATANSTVDVPDEVKKEVEQIFAQLKKSPGTEAHLGWDTEDERLTWTRQARAYCSTREAGALRFRQLPSRNLPATEGRYQVTDDLEKNGERNGRRKTA